MNKVTDTISNKIADMHTATLSWPDHVAVRKYSSISGEMLVAIENSLHDQH